MKADTIKIVGFYAHIYFDTDRRDAAARVREGLAQFEVQLGRWHDKPIGPHPQAMYQVAFLPDQFVKVVPWLMLHREEHSYSRPSRNRKRSGKPHPTFFVAGRKTRAECRSSATYDSQ
jgi:aromatic ring-cleaving dioxygenase